MPFNITQNQFKQIYTEIQPIKLSTQFILQNNSKNDDFDNIFKNTTYKSLKSNGSMFQKNRLVDKNHEKDNVRFLKKSQV